MLIFRSYMRRPMLQTVVGQLVIGSGYPVRVQTMALQSTNDVEE